MTNIFAFDFSCNKPAMTCSIDGSISIYAWPSNIDQVSYSRLVDCGINIVNRDLPEIKDNEFNQHELMMEHLRRSETLVEMITNTIAGIVFSNNLSMDDCVISNEGFAFSAKGDAILNLSGYKYILLDRLFNAGFKNFRTYSPITIKKTAGCSKRGLGKDAMIEAFSMEPEGTHQIIDILKMNPQLLKKKTNYVMCMDDIADSYWCLKTCMKDLK